MEEGKWDNKDVITMMIGRKIKQKKLILEALLVKNENLLNLG